MIIIENTFNSIDKIIKDIEGEKYLLPLESLYFMNFDTPNGVFENVYCDMHYYNSAIIILPYNIYSILKKNKDNFNIMVSIKNETNFISYMLTETEESVNEFCAFAFKNGIVANANMESFIKNNKILDEYKDKVIMNNICLVFNNKEDYLKIKMLRE